MKKVKAEAEEISRFIHDFLTEYAPTRKTSSGHTLRSYETALTLFIGFLEEVKSITSENLSSACFERAMIEEWLDWLERSRGCSPGTCNIRLSSLRVFLRYLGSRKAQYLYLCNEAAKIESRATVKKHVAGMSREAIKALLGAPSQKTKTGRRDLTFMVLLYATAARLNELLDLRVSQLHLKESRPYISLKGKGSKIRTLYLLPRAVAHIEAYLKEFHGDCPDPDDYLFYSKSKGKSGKLTQPAIDKMLKKYARAVHESCADVPLNLHAHIFRHAKATHWFEDGVNLVQISSLLGHAHLHTTMEYLDITMAVESEAMATLEDETSAKAPKKWKSGDKSLHSFCGLKALSKR